MSADAADWSRQPGRGKYARAEHERRFLVREPPPLRDAARLIEDRYLDGMRLRLRRITGDGKCVHKLTQKVRPDANDPSEVLLTNMYLSAAEYARLATLPAQVLTKTRSLVRSPAPQVVVDQFHDRLEGLTLAEVEVADLAEPLDLPAWLGAEVTADDRYSGGSLAVADGDQLRELLRTSWCR